MNDSSASTPTATTHARTFIWRIGLYKKTEEYLEVMPSATITGRSAASPKSIANNAEEKAWRLSLDMLGRASNWQ